MDDSSPRLRPQPQENEERRPRSGQAGRVAGSNVTNGEDTANDWLLIPLVDRLVAAGKTLQPHQCYCYRLLQVLGGGYGIGDFDIKDVSFLYAAFGPIHERIKDLPDGTTIEFKIGD